MNKSDNSIMLRGIIMIYLFLDKQARHYGNCNYWSKIRCMINKPRQYSKTIKTKHKI